MSVKILHERWGNPPKVFPSFLASLFLCRTLGFEGFLFLNKFRVLVTPCNNDPDGFADSKENTDDIRHQENYQNKAGNAKQYEQQRFHHRKDIKLFGYVNRNSGL